MAGLALLFLADRVFGVAFKRPDPFSHFSVRPQAGRVFFLGNSLFKTAFDFEAIGREAALGYTPPFDAHVGHYTNLWYLYATAGFQDVKPSLVVWGFRPTYANRPAFRKRQFGDLDLFRDHWDANYLAKTASGRRSLAERAEIRLGSLMSLYGQRTEARAGLTHAINRGLCSVARRMGRAPICSQLEGASNGRASVADLVQRFSSGGAIRFAEQQMVDAGEAFVTGDKVGFDRSFVPDIAARLTEKGIPQLVVMFKPVSYTTRPVPDEDREFVDDAVRYFALHDIPVLNLVDDPRVQRRHFAEGDHYNGEGRALMTALMSDKLREVTAGTRDTRSSANPPR